MLYLLLAVSLAGVFLTVGRPGRGVRLWIFATALTPCWLGAFVHGLNFIQPATFFAASALAGIVIAGRRRRGVKSRLRAWDAGLLLLLAFAYAATHYGTHSSVVKETVFLWLLPYIVGRWAGLLEPDRSGAFFAKLGAFVGGFSLLEIAAKYHPFTHIDTSSPLGFWAGIQTRGGLDRSEVSFGHSIALGGFLALTVPFAIYYLRGKSRLVTLLLVVGGTFATLSRGPVLAVLLGFVLSLFPVIGPVVARAGRLRVLALALVALALPVAATVQSSAQTDLSTTASYRGNLLHLIPSVRPLGEALNAIYNPVTKTYSFAGYGSVDNALLYIGLTAGWLTAGLLLLGLLATLLRYLAGHVGPAGVAVLAQIPLFLTVALITQYEAFVWFTVGWAVSEQFDRRQSRAQLRQPHRADPELAAASIRWRSP